MEQDRIWFEHAGVGLELLRVVGYHIVDQPLRRINKIIQLPSEYRTFNLLNHWIIYFGVFEPSVRLCSLDLLACYSDAIRFMDHLSIGHVLAI